MMVRLFPEGKNKSIQNQRPLFSAISRIENHAEDIKLSTLGRVAKALGKRLEVQIA
jgi:hypothetical protein